MLSHILHRAGISSIVVERGNADHIATRLPAGGLEHGTVELIKRVGLGKRLQELAMTVHATDFRFANSAHRISLDEVTGHHFTIYPRYEFVSDLLNARSETQEPVLFDSAVVALEGIESGRPIIHFENEAGLSRIECDFIAGCDGYHGISRRSIPAAVQTHYEENYPFSWLGILVDVPPSTTEIAYSCHERGFAMNSFRAATVSLMCLQCEPNDKVENWSDNQIWDELHVRLNVPNRPEVAEGPILQRSIKPMRNFVTEPMSYGRLFLVGDAAHIVPLTGAKGLNSAMYDAALLGSAFIAHYNCNSSVELERYSDDCLRRTWQVQRFAADMCKSLHQFPNSSAFERRVRRAHLEYLTRTETGQRWYAENFVGLPYAFDRIQ